MKEITGPEADKIREYVNADSNGVFWHDSTDHWLYDTGMIQHLGSDRVFEDKGQYLVFTDDAVGIVDVRQVQVA